MTGASPSTLLAQREVLELTADSLDLEAYREAVEAMADQMVGHRIRMQMARFGEQVLDVLTPEQREKLQTGTRMMRHMMDSRDMGGR